MTQTLSFQPFGPEHLDGALRLSRAAGWPHRREDWALAASISLGVAATEGGEVVATALATPYGPVAMANMIIVDSRARGRGLGRQVMERAMALVQPAAWRLVATEAGLPLYEKLGFVPRGEVRQHQGGVASFAPPARVRWAEAADLPGIAAMDRAASGADRSALLAVLAALGRVAVIEGAGYAVLRDFGRGAVAGPVVARDCAAARDLLAFLFAGRTGAFLRVDIPGASGLALWLEAAGLACVDIGVAMQRGESAAPEEFTCFALAAQALG